MIRARSRKLVLEAADSRIAHETDAVHSFRDRHTHGELGTGECVKARRGRYERNKPTLNNRYNRIYCHKERHRHTHRACVRVPVRVRACVRVTGFNQIEISNGLCTLD